MPYVIQGTTNKLKVGTGSDLQGVLPQVVSRIGSVRNFSEASDTEIISPECTRSSLLRTTQEVYFDSENFSTIGSQPTGKFQIQNTTMTATIGTSYYTFNANNTVALATGVRLNTYEQFPVRDPFTTYATMIVGVQQHCPKYTNVDFGFGLILSTNGVIGEPSSGAFFRITDRGVQGVINRSGANTGTRGDGNSIQTEPFVGLDVVPGKQYEFIVGMSASHVEFWVDDVLYSVIETEGMQAIPFMGRAFSFFFRHVNSGSLAAVPYAFQSLLYRYTISANCGTLAMTRQDFVSRSSGASYSSSAGTSSMANYANSANPTAAVPTNTTAALVSTNIGGQAWETDTLAVTTDGIIYSHQPQTWAITTSQRRPRAIVINGITISSFIQTALTGGGYTAQWGLAWGSQAVSLATAEAATTKAFRRIALGFQTVASGALISTKLNDIQVTFQNPIYMVPGDFLNVIKKKIGTAPSAGVVAHNVFVDWGWA